MGANMGESWGRTFLGRPSCAWQLKAGVAARALSGALARDSNYYEAAAAASELGKDSIAETQPELPFVMILGSFTVCYN